MIETTITKPTPAGIPHPLWLELLKYKNTLSRQGAIQYRPERRHGTYRLRFRVFDPVKGYAIRKSISLGQDPLVINGVQGLLEKWQLISLTKNYEAKQEAARHRQEKHAQRMEQKWLEFYLGLIAGGSQNYRQYLIREFRRRDSWGRFALLDYAQRNPKPKRGRPKAGEPRWQPFVVPKRITWQDLQPDCRQLKRECSPRHPRRVLSPANEMSRKKENQNQGDGKSPGIAVMRTPTSKVKNPQFDPGSVPLVTEVACA
jgi:hypothetical protein